MVDVPSREEFDVLQARVESLWTSPQPQQPASDVWRRTYSLAEDTGQPLPGEQSATEHAISIIDVGGRAAAQFLLRPDDPRCPSPPNGPGGYRSELFGQGKCSEGMERWQGAALLVPRDWNQGENATWDDRIIYQWTDQGSPHWSIHLRDGRLVVRQKAFEGQDFRYHYEGDAALGQWDDLAFHTVWARGPGGRVMQYAGRTLAVRDSADTKWGIYGQPTRLLYGEHTQADGPRRLGDVDTRWR